MNNRPKVSVVLPFFNADQTLEECIQSIVNQTFMSWELLLIDNNSTDNSHSIATRFCQEDPRVKLVQESVQGVVYAANRGFELAQGEYIARMDADDVCRPERLLRQVELLDNNQDIDVASGLVQYLGDSTNGGFIRYVDWLNSIISESEIRLNQFAEYPIANPSMMIRKSVFRQYCGFREGDFPEDYEFFLRLQENGVKMEKVNEIVIDWRDSPHRLTRTDTRYSQESFFKIKAQYLARWLGKYNPQHPNVAIWGGGKLAKKRSKYLQQFGVQIKHHIGVSPGENCIHFTDIDKYRDDFILSYVTNWDARSEVREFLNEHGFEEGINYMICA